MCKVKRAQIDAPQAKQSSGYTLKELSQYAHVSKSPTGQILTAVNSKVIDITKFVKNHPGGDLILLAAGRDATVLWETYHPACTPGSSASKRMSAVLKKYEIGSLVDNKPSFYTFTGGFYPTLKRRVCERLEERNLGRRGGNGEIHIKAILLLSIFWSSLAAMCLLPGYLYPLLSCFVMGLTASFVGTCIQHDGSHGAFSNSLPLNKAAGWTLDMIGASAFTWEIQHMLGHHPYTNLLDVEGVGGAMDGTKTGQDDDIESDPDIFSSFPLMRMHPHHKREWYHRYQHIYAPVLFSAMTLAKVFMQDVEIITQKRLYHIDATCRYGSILNVLRFWSMKVLSFLYMIFLPCYFQGIGKGLLLFFVGHLTCGEMLATMFIVNHVIEGVAFAQKNDDGGVNTKTFKPVCCDGTTPMEESQQTVKDGSKTDMNDWAAVQCQTSVNWSVGSWFWNHFSGGLNHQIEHHLFPSICHTNYVDIQDIVQATCKEFGVPYQHEPSLFSAYPKMINHLRFLGSKDKIS